MSTSYITCPNCKTVNINQQYCTNCGTILDINLKRKLEREEKAKTQQLKREAEKKEPSRIELFLKNGAEHRNFFIRSIFQIGYYTWLFFALLIGGLISLVIAAAAG